MVGIISSMILADAITEATGVRIPFRLSTWPSMGGGLAGGPLDQRLTAMGVPDGLPQALVAGGGAILLSRLLTRKGVNPGIKIGKRQILRVF
jgi:hypothetical protein